MEAIKNYKKRMEALSNRGKMPEIIKLSQSEQSLVQQKNKLTYEIEALRERLNEREKELAFSLKAMHIVGIPFVPVETIEQQMESLLNEIEQKQRQLALLENYR